jgi:hypothetical protein
MEKYYRDSQTGRFVKDPGKRAQEALEELYRAFDFFNEYFTNNELPKVVITIQEAGRRNAYGWFGNGFWSDKTCKNGVGEINLSAEYMGRKPEGILETLLHEMAHLKNAINGVRDCTSGQYHNKHFKRAAEEFGLVVERGGNKGYAFTSLGKDADEAIKKLNPNGVVLSTLSRKRVKQAREKRYISLIISAGLEDDLQDAIEASGMTQKEFVEDAVQTAIDNVERKEFIKEK